QTAPGTYSLTVGPDIRDLANNQMDQNQNGINGEVPGDQYTASFNLVAAGVPTKFDFGTATSPVAAGYTQVTAATAYSVAQHYGWLSGVIFDKDYPTATDPLTRDFNYTSNGTFAVDVANGSYSVTVTMGSASFAKVNMGVFLQGTQVDSVSTAAG